MYITDASDAYIQQRTLSNIISALNPNSTSALHISTYISIPNRVYSGSANQKKKIKNFFVNDEKVERKEKLPKASKSVTPKSTASKKRNGSGIVNKDQKLTSILNSLIEEEMKNIEEKRLASREEERLKTHFGEYFSEHMKEMNSLDEEDADYLEKVPISSSRPSTAGNKSGRRKKSHSGNATIASRRNIHVSGILDENEYFMSLDDAEVMQAFQISRHELTTQKSFGAYGNEIYDDLKSPTDENTSDSHTSRQRVKSRGKIFSSEPKHGKPTQRSAAPQTIRNGDKKEMKQVLLSQFELTNVLTDQLSELKRKNKLNK